MKMQRKVRFFVILLAVAVLFCGSPRANATGKEPTWEERVAGQKMAVEANEALMRYFFDNGWITEFPDFFGGRYIEDNILHIRLVSPSDQTMAFLNEILAPYADAVEYERCDVSRTYALKRANEIALQLINKGYSVSECYAESKTGDIVIGVPEEDINDAKMEVESYQANTRAMTPLRITITESKPFEAQTTTLHGGTRIRIASEGASVGACGSYGGENAFVSCAHYNVQEGDSVTAENSIIGTVVKAQYSYLEPGDYSIIVFNDNALTSHKVGHSNNFTIITNGAMDSPAPGTTVTKYGDGAGYAYGTVVETDTRISNTNGKMITGMTIMQVTSGTCVGGDSGGSVLAGNAFCGVVNGAKSENNSLIISFTPYNIIRSAGFTVIGSHNCTRWSDAGASYHSSYCGICQETVYESHAAYWNQAFGRCMRCGRTGANQI